MKDSLADPRAFSLPAPKPGKVPGNEVVPTQKKLGKYSGLLHHSAPNRDKEHRGPAL